MPRVVHAPKAAESAAEQFRHTHSDSKHPEKLQAKPSNEESHNQEKHTKASKKHTCFAHKKNH